MSMVLMILAALATPTAAMGEPPETCKSDDGEIKDEQDGVSLAHYVCKKLRRASIWSGPFL